jgi:hypothetical protein
VLAGGRRGSNDWRHNQCTVIGHGEKDGARIETRNEGKGDIEKNGAEVFAPEGSAS